MRGLCPMQVARAVRYAPELRPSDHGRAQALPIWMYTAVLSGANATSSPTCIELLKAALRCSSDIVAQSMPGAISFDSTILRLSPQKLSRLRTKPSYAYLYRASAYAAPGYTPPESAFGTTARHPARAIPTSSSVRPGGLRVVSLFRPNRGKRSRPGGRKQG